MAEDHNEEEQMIINQEFKIWKKSSPYNYDFSLTRSLEWPSTSIQWLPDIDEDGDYYNHYAYITSNCLDSQLSELQKIRIKTPKQGKVERYISEETNKIQVISRKALGSEINRARYCLAQPDLVATSHSNGQILLSYKNQVCYKLYGHTADGYGLAWNPVNHSIIATGSTDKKIMVWDVQKTKQETNKIESLIEIQGGAPVEDVAWHKMHANILGSCSDDRVIMLWDTRFRATNKESTKKPLFQIIAHTNQIYSLDFSPFNQFIFLSGSADENVSIWDIRNLTRSVETLSTQGSVVKVQWSPHAMNIFASCGYDHKVYLWDLSAMSTASQFSNSFGKKEEQGKGKESKEKADRQKGLIFSHEGHRSKVLDFDWNMNERMLIGSVEQANCLHVWQMKKQIYYGEAN